MNLRIAFPKDVHQRLKEVEQRIECTMITSEELARHGHEEAVQLALHQVETLRLTERTLRKERELLGHPATLPSKKKSPPLHRLPL